MIEPKENLGKLVAVHVIAPAYLQRAAIVAVLSFVFFIAMLVAFYIRESFGYFLLSTGFLVVYFFTFISWVTQRRNVVKIFENGIRYKKFEGRWDEIESADFPDKIQIKGKKINPDKVSIPSSILGFHELAKIIQKKTAPFS